MCVCVCVCGQASRSRATLSCDSSYLVLKAEGGLEGSADKQGGSRPVSNQIKVSHSRGTKVGDMLTLAPERYTAGLCMVTKVIP